MSGIKVGDKVKAFYGERTNDKFGFNSDMQQACERKIVGSVDAVDAEDNSVCIRFNDFSAWYCAKEAFDNKVNEVNISCYAIVNLKKGVILSTRRTRKEARAAMCFEKKFTGDQIKIAKLSLDKFVR